MKKIVLFILFILSFSICVCANNVSNIDITVSVFDNGDALVTQIWNGEFNDGTENYIVIGNLNGIEVSDFKVFDENTTYTYIDNWNVNASFSSKKNKCGVIKNKGSYELCWGIGDYGKRSYTISYLLKGFVSSYEDKDGSNFMYVNPGMSTFPTHVNFRLFLEDETSINDAVSDIWAFGFDGEVRFSGGEIVANTFSPLRDDMHFQIMFSLDKGIISPTHVKSSSFEDLKKIAFKNSDYKDNDNLIAIVLSVVLLIAVSGFVSYVIVLISERKKFTKNTEYFRETPNNANLSLSYYLCQNFGVGGDEGGIIGALILSMINDKNIETDVEKTVSAFGREKESHQIRLVSRPQKEPQGKLYDIMIKAAGDDGVLQEKELEKYASRNYKVLRYFIDGCKENGENVFCEMGGFCDGISNRIKSLTDVGKEQLSQIVGIKKYLDDFSLIAEREIGEITIWKEYLIYATLFGSADKALAQMKKLYPSNIPEIETYTRQVNMTSVYYSSMYRSMIRAEQKARSSGSGGRASFGGGGGFSGGGRGGGSR